MIGIVGYGAYIPLYRIKAEEIANVWGKDVNSIKKGLLIEEKSVPGIDEDTVTMSIEAGKSALKRAKINVKEIGALYSGSESKVYAVKPNASIVGEALGLGVDYSSADLEFACKAGTAGMQMVMGLVKSDFIKYGMAIGTDTSQSKPNDILEYSASAGAAAFIIGKDKKEVLAEVEGTYSCSTDTADFWRRNLQAYPKHTERFTGEPAYFKHTVLATKKLMEKLGLKNSDFDHVVFHMPNGKFPLKATKILEFDKVKLKYSLIVGKIGNTYSASSLLGLTNVLDNAKPNERILMTSFGSGAGSDSFSFIVTDLIKEKVKLANLTQEYIERKKYVSYTEYLKFTGAIG